MRYSQRTNRTFDLSEEWRVISKRYWRRVGLLLFLLSACGSVTGCQRNQPAPVTPPANPSAEAAKPYTTSFSARGWYYHFRQFTPDAAADQAKPREVWRQLLPGLAKDPQTRDLLRHLHADLPVEFVVLDPKQAEDDTALLAPPAEGYAIAMRVAEVHHGEKKSKASTVPIKVIAYGHVILLRDAQPSAAPDTLGALSENWKKEPSPGEPLSLAMEDYVLRHAPGWTIIGGPFFESEKLPHSVEEQRRELERGIKRYADHAKAYYGALRGRR
jgi:hypothetical protein